MQKDTRVAEVQLGLLSEPAPKYGANAIPGELLTILCPLDNAKIKTALQGSTTAPLTTFPVEIWIHILLSADVRTLTTFRAVSHTARKLVDSIPQYKDIVRGFPNLLRAVLCTGVASWVSLSQLSEALLSTSCICCNRSGEYIHLLSCCRMCRACLLQEKRMRPLTLAEAREGYELPTRTLARIPQVHTIPGKYSRRPTPIGHRITLVDRPTLNRVAAKRPRKSDPGPRGTCSLAEHLPFMWALRTPWIDSRSHGTCWGYRCRPCARNGIPLHEERATYDRQSFLDHVQSCDHAQTEWTLFFPSQ